MSEIRVNNVIADNGLDAVNFSKGINVSSGIITATSFSASSVNLTDNVVIGTAGKGIDYSAQTATSITGSSTSSELLDHYEEGTFTPVLASGTSLTVYRADFVRIGRLCHIELGVLIGTNSSGTVLRFERLPFTFNPGGDNAAGLLLQLLMLIEMIHFMETEEIIGFPLPINKIRM